MTNAELLINKLIDLDKTITTAESCTGGLLASMLIDVPGTSKVFNEGHITYANEAKMKYLKVPDNILRTKGAVSEETAYAMAEGAAKLACADLSLVTTGLAGPDGGTKEKPVGLVYIACYYDGSVTVEKKIFEGDRSHIRLAAANAAIEYALSRLSKSVW